MKFITNTKTLLEALKKVAPAIPTRSVLPIIENFLFEVDAMGMMTITTTNQEISMQTRIQVEGSQPVCVAVPAKMTLDILGSLPIQPVTVDIKEDTITITASTGKYKISCQGGDDFPKLENTPSGYFSLDGAMFGRGLEKVMFAASTDEDKAALNGVYFASDGLNLDLVATDAHRLQRYRVTANNGLPEIDVIIPLRAVSILKGLCNNNPVEMATDVSHGYFNIDGVLVIARLLDQKYPNYEAVIPTQNSKVLTVNKKEFLSALKRVKIFANKSTNQAKLSCKGKILTLECIDPDFQNKALETLEVDYHGEDIEIGFNAENLFQSISKIDGHEVKLEMSAPNRAAVIFPVEQVTGESITGLVMPIMLNTYQPA